MITDFVTYFRIHSSDCVVSMKVKGKRCNEVYSQVILYGFISAQYALPLYHSICSNDTAILPISWSAFPHPFRPWLVKSGSSTAECCWALEACTWYHFKKVIIWNPEVLSLVTLEAMQKGHHDHSLFQGNVWEVADIAVEMWWSAIFFGRVDQAPCHPVVEWRTSLCTQSCDSWFHKEKWSIALFCFSSLGTQLFHLLALTWEKLPKALFILFHML